MQLVQIYKKRKRKKMMNKIASYVDLHKNSYYGEGFGVDLRNPVQGRKFLKIGSGCIIDANFVFEKDSGYIEIGDRSFVAGTLISIDGIVVGNNVIVAWDTLIYDHNSHSVFWNEREPDMASEYKNYKMYGNPTVHKNWEVVKSGKIVIKDKAWIGTGCKIMKGVTIGEGAIVAAGSVVVCDVEDWTMVGGNPAQVIKRLNQCNGQDGF